MPRVTWQRGNKRRIQPSDEFMQILEKTAEETGVNVHIFSPFQEKRGRNRTGSTRHDHDIGAVDLRLKDDDGKVIRDEKVWGQFVERLAARGMSGFGQHPDYMGGDAIHAGYGSRMVWGAGGKSANAPRWLRQAANRGWAMYDSGKPLPAIQPIMVASNQETPLPPPRPSEFGGYREALAGALKGQDVPRGTVTRGIATRGIVTPASAMAYAPQPPAKPPSPAPADKIAPPVPQGGMFNPIPIAQQRQQTLSGPMGTQLSGPMPVRQPPGGAPPAVKVNPGMFAMPAQKPPPERLPVMAQKAPYGNNTPGVSNPYEPMSSANIQTLKKVQQAAEGGLEAMRAGSPSALAAPGTTRNVNGQTQYLRHAYNPMPESMGVDPGKPWEQYWADTPKDKTLGESWKETKADMGVGQPAMGMFKSPFEGWNPMDTILGWFK